MDDIIKKGDLVWALIDPGQVWHADSDAQVGLVIGQAMQYQEQHEAWQQVFCVLVGEEMRWIDESDLCSGMK